MAVCGACGTTNREGRRFCAQCGARLAIECPSCRTTNEPGERFCGECGTALADPAALVTRVGPVLSEGERKQVTVLFADVSGSMDLQSGLDPEVWAKMMDRFVTLLAEGVERFGGTVDKFTGDGIMALFGAPLAYEDHARRGCLAALTMSSAVADYAAELRRTVGLGFAVRIGLNSGEVVTGGIAGGSYTAVGHTVGLAQRMEALAEPGRAYLTEATAELAGPYFALSDLGPHEVKGSPEPVRVFALDGVASRLPSTSVPLVGRDAEMAELEAALVRVEAGETLVVGVVGLAGVGKSRLCEEFAVRCAERNIMVRRAAGLAHATSVPMLPILELFRDYFGISIADSPPAARERIAGRLLLLDPAFVDDLALVFDFLEVPDPQRPAPNLPPEARLRRIFQVLRRLTQRRTEREPLVLVLEDLHWFDPQSAAFVERLIAQLPGGRTLVVANFRPEFTAGWLGTSYYRSLPLGPLDAEAADGLLAAMLGIDASLAPLVPLIVERTGGNPFFVEEVVRDLIEAGTLAGVPGAYQLTQPVTEIHVPRSVHAILAARIDRLPAQERRVLQTAAVIGRSFPGKILAAVSAAEVDDALSALCARELLQATEPDGYRFWHPLTQEVAATTLLAERRSAIHAAVARVLIEAEPDRLDENSALIAAHWEAAGSAWEAAKWNARAANHAYRHDLTESVRRCRISMTQLRSVDHEDALRLEVQVRNRLVRFGSRTGMDDDELAQLLAAGRVLAEQVDDPRLQAELAAASGTAVLWRGHIAEALEEYRRSLALAQSVDDTERALVALVSLSVIRRWTGPTTDGLEHAEQVVRLTGGDPKVGVSLWGFGFAGLGLLFQAEHLRLTGDRTAARNRADQATRVLRNQSELEWLAWSLALDADLAETVVEFDSALAHATEALGIADDSANSANRVVALRGSGRLAEWPGSLR